MGIVERLFSLVFSGSNNLLRETAEVFRENAEARAVRDADLRQATLGQQAAEFAIPRKGGFDRVMDGINRIPRPAMALGILGLFLSAMVHPVWFAARMQGLALVPEPLWWLLGVIVSFYFGARQQMKGQEFQQSILQSMARVPQVVENLRILNALSPGVAVAGDELVTRPDPGGPPNAALRDWRAAQS